MKKIFTFLMLSIFALSAVYAAKAKIAFVYTEGYTIYTTSGDRSGTYDPDNDPMFQALNSVFDVTKCNYASSSETPDLETLKTYDLVVFSEAMSGSGTLTLGLEDLVGQVPVFSTKAFAYKSDRWGWAAPVNPSTKPTTSITIAEGFENNDIFKNLEIGPDNSIELYSAAGSYSNNIQGFNSGDLVTDSPIEQDKYYAYAAGETSTIALHEIDGLGEKYMFLGLSADCIWALNQNAKQLCINICNYLTGGSSGFDPDAPRKIAYLYDSSYSTYCGIDNDPLYNFGIFAEKSAEAIDIKDFTAESIDTLDALRNYDLIVVSEAMSSGHPFAKVLKQIINKVPVLNFKSYLYKSTVWNWGGGVNPTEKKNNESGAKNIIVSDDYIDNPLFFDVPFEDGDTTIGVFVNDTVSNMIQGYSVSSGSDIAGDSVYAYVRGSKGKFNAIHRHGGNNAYMLIPLSYDALIYQDASNINESFYQLLANAVNILLASKSSVYPVTKPTFELIYEDAVTKVVITSVTDAANIYYTTDGSIPSVSSSLYKDTIDITVDSAVVKAIAVKEGYDNSPVDSVIVPVKTKLLAPEIIVADSAGGKKVTITAAEGTIYYNESGVTPTTSSKVYNSPLYFVRPVTITAIAAEEGKLNSDPAIADVSIEGYVERNAMMMFADFKNYPSIWMWGDMEKPAGDNIDVISNYTYIEPTDSTAPYDTAVVFTNGFKVGTQGQRINLQSTGTKDDIGSSYGPYSSYDVGATSFAMTFLRSLPDKGPATAYIVTPKAYSGPLNIDVWLTGGRGETSKTELCEVSYSTTGADGSWTVIDTLTTLSDKLIRKRTAYYDGTEAVYLKFAAVSKNGKYNNMMIFDVKVSGQGEVVPAPEMVVDTTEAGTTDLTIADDEAGVEIYYTTSGYIPTQDSTKYTSPLTFTEGTTVNAYAVRGGKYISDVTTYKVPIVTAINNATTDRELVSEEIYTISGVKINGLSSGLNIVVDKYSDGTMKTSKVIVNEK